MGPTLLLHTQGLVVQGLCVQFHLVDNPEVAPEDAKCLVGIVGDGVDMGTPFHVILDVDTKLSSSADVFKDLST